MEVNVNPIDMADMEYYIIGVRTNFLYVHRKRRL